MKMNKDDVIDMLKKKQGEMTQKEFAAEIDCSLSYLIDLYAGRRDPGPKILDFLGIERQRVVTYEKVK